MIVSIPPRIGKQFLCTIETAAKFEKMLAYLNYSRSRQRNKGRTRDLSYKFKEFRAYE